MTDTFSTCSLYLLEIDRLLIAAKLRGLEGTDRMAYDRLSNYKTTVHTENDTTICVYHHTPIVRSNNREIILDSGGWQTVTTKRKMNQYSHQYCNGYYSVYQKDYTWYVEYNDTVVEFEDGMSIPVE